MHFHIVKNQLLLEYRCKFRDSKVWKHPGILNITNNNVKGITS